MRYDLDELTAENGSVLGDLVHDTSAASLALSPDLADELRRRIDQVNASLVEGAKDSDVKVGRRHQRR